MNDLDGRYYAARAELDALHYGWGFHVRPEKDLEAHPIPETAWEEKRRLGEMVRMLALERWEAVPEAERKRLREWVWARMPKA